MSVSNRIIHTAVIGAGFSGLSAAAYLARAGCNVDVFEKNAEVGGRARQLITNCGYTFDMGPSWYWMPDVFEKFFNDFGYKPSDFYELKLLDPEYILIFGKEDVLEIPASNSELLKLFESIEKGSAQALIRFLKEAEFKYQAGMNNLVYKPGLSLGEFANASIIKGILRLQIFTSLSSHVRKFFKNERLRALLEFPALFLGAMPEETPALYSLMNYAGLELGTWYPVGGFGKVVEAMKTVAERQGVKFYLEEPATGFEIRNNSIAHIYTNYRKREFEGVVAAADYHHVDQQLLDAKYRNYGKKYWKTRTMAPSALIFYLGVTKKVKKLKHHNLFFDEDLRQHAQEIYKAPQWPSRPLFYVCCTSKTDDSTAPAGHENLFILMPLAVGIHDGEETRERYFKIIMDRLEAYCGEAIRNYLDYEKSYCVSDFKNDYNSFKGNAYGLANTLRQTAIMKPSMASKKLKNLFFAGHLTVPGPGVPPAIISGQIAAQQLLKYLEVI